MLDTAECFHLRFAAEKDIEASEHESGPQHRVHHLRAKSMN